MRGFLFALPRRNSVYLFLKASPSVPRSGVTGGHRGFVPGFAFLQGQWLCAGGHAAQTKRGDKNEIADHHDREPCGMSRTLPPLQH